MEVTGFFAQLVNIPYLATIPVVVLILGLIIRKPWKESLQGAIKVAMGAFGMVALTYFTIKVFAPAAVGAAANIGGPMIDMTLVDVGWATSFAGMVSPMMWLNILIFVAINLGLIWIRATKTLYVDFPAMWRGAWTGMVVWVVTDSFLWGTVAMELYLITGSLLGILAGFDIANILIVGFTSAMMFHFWPVALGALFDGWSVFNEGMRNILLGWIKDKREVYTAVDTSVLLGHPSVGISTTLMYPLAFLLAVFVPGVGLFPIISIQIIQWWMAHITGWTKGNIIHNLVICSVVVVLYSWAATAMAEPTTFWVQHYGMIPQEWIDAGIQVTNWDGGGDLRTFLLYKLFSLF